jgi:DNA-binding IscR family transcriptional regulator
VATNLDFYGSIGLIPVFMIGLYFSWVFLLLGAQIAYAFQNRAAYLQDRLADNVNQRGREFVALRLMTRLGERFYNGAPPATVNQLSKELGIPTRLTHSILRTLAANSLVRELAGVEAAFVPGRPLDTISAHDILYALRTGTGQGLPTDGAPELTEIYGEFAAIEQAERQAAATISLLALARRMPSTNAIAEPKTVRPENQIAEAEIIPEPTSETTVFEAEKVQPTPFVSPIKESNEPATEAPKVKAGTEGSPENAPLRREVVMPEENREFPL